MLSSGSFTVKQLSCLLVQDVRSVLQDAFRHQGGAGSHRLHGDGAGGRGLSLQQVMVDHLHHRLLQAAVGPAAQVMKRGRWGSKPLLAWVLLPGQKVVVHQRQLQASGAVQRLQLQLLSEEQHIWRQPAQS